ncbi:hypothetical protein AWI43_28065 [Streptomyces sp. WAC04657]|nr:hypothetical protein AWI43_28065 [Streptomyces sp. WAC04657]
MPGGIRRGVARETRTMVRKPSGTDQTAGQAIRVCGQPPGASPARVAMTAARAEPPPSRSPAIAPGGVSRRHQMPRTSSGQKEEAETAKARPTASATGTLEATTPTPSGTAVASRVASRKCRTPREGSTSWVRTPATDMVSPEAVERKAAKAPPARSAPSRSPGSPPRIRSGRTRTAASAEPVRASSGA